MNLNDCKPGDKLRTRSGDIAIYQERGSHPIWPHKALSNNIYLSFTNEGFFYNESLKHPEDIMEILTKTTIDPKNAPRGTIAVAEVEPNSCEGCIYESESTCGDNRPCLHEDRPDGQNVIFIQDYEAVLRQAEAIRALRDLAPLEVDTEKVTYIQMRNGEIDPISPFAKTVLATYNQDLQAAAQKALDTLRAHYQAIADGKA